MTSLASLGTKGAKVLAAFFTDDAVWHNILLAPVTERYDIATTIASFTTGIESIELRVRNTSPSDGPVVLTGQVDVFRFPDKSIELPVMGTFEVCDGKGPMLTIRVRNGHRTATSPAHPGARPSAGGIR